MSSHIRSCVSASLRLLAGACLLLPAGVAFAQDTTPPPGGSGVLDEIVVTAQKREQSLKDVPISVSAIAGDLIADRSVDNLADLSSSIPNLFITESQISNHINIRGIRTGANKGFEQSVALYVDGVYYGRDQLIRLPLVDLERVEVLRGPQPTLFGKNAIAGALSVTSAPPTEEFEASFSASWEFEHDEFQLQAMVSGPITEDLSGRFVASWREMDGWIDNLHINETEPAPEELFLRGTLAWDDDGPFRASLKAEYAEFDTEGRQLENNTPIGTYSTNPLFGQGGVFEVDTREDWRSASSHVNSLNEIYDFVLTAEADIADLTLVSVSSYVAYETTELIDVDYIAANFLDGTNQAEDYDQFSQELRVTSPGGEFIDYIAGFYFQDNALTVTDEVFFGSDLPGAALMPLHGVYTDRFYTQESTLWSVFAQADVNFTEAIALTIGARYNSEDKDGRRRLAFVTPEGGNAATVSAVLAGFNMVEHDVTGKRDESSFDPLIRLQYRFDDSLLTYLSYSEGTKAGGFDIRSNSLPEHQSLVMTRAGTFEFEDEDAESWELGAKFADERFELNLAVYRTEYANLQTNIFDGVLGFLVLNASKITTQGVEADGRFALTDELLAYASVAYLDFEYDDFQQGQCAFGQTPNNGSFCDFTGERASHTPEWTANIGLDYETPFFDRFVLDVNLNLDYSDDYLLLATLDRNQIQDNYWKFGLTVGIADAEGRWRVSLIADNLTDERIMLTSGTLPLATVFTQRMGVAYDSFYDRPRNIALKIEYDF